MPKVNSCPWTTGASYPGVIKEYFNFVNLYNKHTDHGKCKDSPVIPVFNWIEISFIFICAIVMAHFKYGLINGLIRKIQTYLPQIPLNDCFKIALYTVKFIETSLFVGALIHLLVNSVPCSAIWNLNLLNYSVKTPFSLELLSFFALARTLSHFYDLLVANQYEHRNDNHIMVLHHFVTLTLLIYSRNNLTIGMWVLLLHDICDPFLDICKVVYYTMKYLPESIASRYIIIKALTLIRSISYNMLVITWIVCRLYLFPTRILYGTIIVSIPDCKFSIGLASVTLFFILIFMHIMWFILLLKLFVLYNFYGVFEDLSVDNESEIEMNRQKKK